MPDGLANVLHDAAVLHGFVDFIEQYCKEQERTQTYVGASGLFFEYVETLAAGIKRELGREVARANPARLPLLRSKIWTLKYYLRLLHALIKPAADAHILSIPAPLIDLASQQLQDVVGMEKSSIVILLTPEFMYFQRPHTNIKQQAHLVESFITDASFPRKLGFIEVPYSQGSSFFTNLAIYHEMGHFVYEELSNLSPANDHIKALKSATAKSLNKVFSKGPKNRQVFALADKIIENWTQEIFCDLLALRLVGPAFSFALIEMLGMLGFLSEKESMKFNPTHPASACRFAEHVTMLREDLWWDAIAGIEPEQKKLLERLANIPRSKYKFYVDEQALKPQSLGHSLVDVFLDIVVPAIRKLVRQVTPEAKTTVDRFKRNRSEIEDCLRVGVVPHTTKSAPLDPISIINSAFCFYLTSLPEVIEQFEGTKAKNDVDKHSLWTKRLEMWTMKAIEDSQIQRRFKKVKDTALWSSLEMKS